jgi:hypothetical protein
MTTRRCSRGKILRATYTRRIAHSRRRVRVSASCIRDVGRPGKGLATGLPDGMGKPGIGKLREGDLAQFGYTHVTTLDAPRRHLALARAVAKYGALTVFRKLNAVYVYTRNTAPASSRIFKADRNWVKAYYGV